MTKISNKPTIDTIIRNRDNNSIFSWYKIILKKFVKCRIKIFLLKFSHPYPGFIIASIFLMLGSPEKKANYF